MGFGFGFFAAVGLILVAGWVDFGCCTVFMVAWCFLWLVGLCVYSGFGFGGVWFGGGWLGFVGGLFWW